MFWLNNDGKWTLEYGRKLITGSKYDVQFSDLKKGYAFGTAIFDNAQTRHSFETGASRLIFAGTTPIATTVTPVATTAAPTPGFEFLFAISAVLFIILSGRR